jgi:tryptophanyl-tRNA synthetase
LPGIDGQHKMSKSLGNAIFLKDSNDEIARKVKMCYTDPNHIRVSDPGKIEGNVVFAYLDAFYQDKADLEQLKQYYQKGGLGDGILKNKLSEILIALIEPIRLRRQIFAQDLNMVGKILFAGCEKALHTATENFAQIEKIMQLDYKNWLL